MVPALLPVGVSGAANSEIAVAIPYVIGVVPETDTVTDCAPGTDPTGVVVGTADQRCGMVVTLCSYPNRAVIDEL